MKYKKIWTQLEVDWPKLLFLWMLNHHCSGAWFYVTGRLLPVHASVNTDHLQYFVKILFYVLLLEGFAYYKTVQTGIHFSFKPFSHFFFLQQSWNQNHLKYCKWPHPVPLMPLLGQQHVCCQQLHTVSCKCVHPGWSIHTQCCTQNHRVLSSCVGGS